MWTGRRCAHFFACAAKCELDAQGRALLPQQLRDFAGLVKNVAVVGCDDHAELWAVSYTHLTLPTIA